MSVASGAGGDLHLWLAIVTHQLDAVLAAEAHRIFQVELTKAAEYWSTVVVERLKNCLLLRPHDYRSGTILYYNRRPCGQLLIGNRVRK
jgi:hypothetical protein